MAIKLPREIYRNWSAGVVSSARSEELPVEASPRGRNSQLYGVGLGRAIPGTRRGATPLLPTPLGIATVDPAVTRTVHSQHVYRRLTGGAYTYTHLAVLKETGDLFRITAGGTATLFGSGTFGVNGVAPMWATFQNNAYALAGAVRKKVVDVSGTLTVQNLGLLRPPARAATSFNWNAAASAGAGSMSGAYEVALTFYNEHAQLESSRSDGYTVSGLSSKGITVTWATSPDTQITHVRVHIRKDGVNVNFLEVTSGTGYVAGKGVPIGTATTTIDISDTTLVALKASPDTLEHNPPATDPTTGTSIDTLIAAVPHGSRLLVFSPTGFYWSQFDQPEQFDPESFEPINPDDGDTIVAAHAISDNLVVIFKRRAMYALVGLDPNSWEIQRIDPTIGCVAPRSVASIDGRVYWWSELGPVSWAGQGAPSQFGAHLLRDSTIPQATNPAAWANICAYAYPQTQHVVFWVPEAGSSINNIGLPFNYAIQVWESDRWDPFDVASAVIGEDNNGRPVPLLGGYYSQIYQWGNTDVDGVNFVDLALAASSLMSGSVTGIDASRTVLYTPSWVGMATGHRIFVSSADGETVEGQVFTTGFGASASIVLFEALPVGFTPVAYTIDPAYTLTGTIAAASTVGAATRLQVDRAIFDPLWVGPVYAYIPSTAGGGATQRRRIVAVGYNEPGGYAYVDVSPVLDYDPSAAVGRHLHIAAPCFSWDTRWSDSGEPFVKKRYMHTNLACASPGGAQEVTLTLFEGYNVNTPSRVRTYTVNTGGAAFDASVFDLSVYGGEEGRGVFRTAIGRLARSLRMRVEACTPNRPFLLLALGLDATLLVDRR